METEKYVGEAPGRQPLTIMVRDGRYVDPFDLQPGDLRIDYMLYGLPNVTRFTGQFVGAKWGSPLRKAWRWLNNRTCFYSVAQHQTIGARWLLAAGEWDLARWFIMHDAVEFAMGDMSRPVKYRPGMEEYVAAEHMNLERVARKFGLSWPMPPAVKEMDNIMLATEVRDLQGDAPWNLPDPLPWRIEPWTPTRAFVEYRETLKELMFL